MEQTKHRINQTTGKPDILKKNVEDYLARKALEKKLSDVQVDTANIF